MKKTTNYQLNQWDAADPIRRADFNADNAKIDAALAANAQALADYQTSNDAAVAQKADQSAFADYRQTTDAALTVLDTALAALGSAGKNARIAWGTYTGTNTYGESTPTSLAFDFCPVIVFVGSDKHAGKHTNPSVFLRGRTQVPPDCIYEGISVYMTVTWTDSGLSWYSTTSADAQNNRNTVYCYAAIGYDKAAEEAGDAGETGETAE
ncbi:MAG: hypothetical protein ACI3XJ_07495 [Oscillospiraceae bacterium]